MSTARLTKFFLGMTGVSSLLYGATKFQIGTNETERGVIEHVITDKDKHGNFINNNTMYFQHVSQPGSASLIDMVANMRDHQPMDLRGDPELIKKAQEYCDNKTIVEVKYDQFLAGNPFTGKPSRRANDITELPQENKMRL